MIRRLAALCLAVLCLVLPAGSAAARPSAIVLLREELELRRDVDLAGTLENRYYTPNATLTLTTFDLAAKRITGTFSFTATSGIGQAALTVNAANGVVDVKDFTVE